MIAHSSNAQYDELEGIGRSDSDFRQKNAKVSLVGWIVARVTFHEEGLDRRLASESAFLPERNQKAGEREAQLGLRESIVGLEHGPLRRFVDGFLDHHDEATDVDEDPIRIAAHSAGTHDAQAASGQGAKYVDAAGIQNAVLGWIDGDGYVLNPRYSSVGGSLVNTDRKIAGGVLTRDMAAGWNVASDRGDGL